MKNLLTKTLFISLLLPVAMPSGVQASFFTEKFDRVELGVQAGLAAGIIAMAALVGPSVKVNMPLAEILGEKGVAVLKLILGEKGVAEVRLAALKLILGGGAVGAAIGAVGAELTLETEGAVATGAGVGAGLGTIGGTIAGLSGLSGLSKLAKLAGLSTMIGGGRAGTVVAGMEVTAVVIVMIGGALGGARVGAATVRKIREYFDLKTATDEII